MSKSSLFVKSKPSGAEVVRRRLLELGVFNGECSVLREKGYVLFPVKEEVKIKDCEITSRQSKYRKKKPKSLRVALKGKLSEHELESLPSSFDLIGDIAVIELPDELLPKKEVVGQALISTFKNINVAAVKSSPVGTEYRTRSVEVVAGENRTETVHKEYGC
ncbi:MAG: tRNA (guanine-N1)-methyltransferase, partial [Methanobacteriota archaeon]